MRGHRGQDSHERLPVTPGGYRIEMGGIPGPILALWTTANAALRGAWTLSERLREIIRLYSAFEQQCHT